MTATLRAILIDLAIMLAISLVLAALGPFGSFAMGDYAARLGYWLPAALLGYAVFRPSYIGGIAAARKLDFPEAAGAAAGVMTAAIPACLLIFLWNGNRLEQLSGFGHWFQLYVQVAIVGGVVATIFALIEQRNRAPVLEIKAQDEISETQLPASSAFLDRLPPDIASNLIALEMEDHYVRAHAPGRSTLILLRMRDAEAELSGIDGMRVHRSWWVVRSAVEQVVRDSRNLRLKLRGGIEAPVARDRAAALRQAGWTD